ncbi:hypothetical protein BPAE_0068g00270 [Botrytis paeoniae]|uniref:Uncharacterized protein n=1 Tax=Botrytis paeoniae TaxID=278948 RepID=A0A4Z1FUU7_9HELO|nr:hypothetical protein BPAE_0068g00270 [Botrytis paeoniae]
MPCHTGTGESSTPVHTHDIRQPSVTVDLTVLPVQGSFKPKAAIQLFGQLCNIMGKSQSITMPSKNL